MLAFGDSKFDRELRKQFDLENASELTFDDIKRVIALVQKKEQVSLVCMFEANILLLFICRMPKMN
jgi:hypothetical protein